jgi:hypothetical protein
MVLHNKRCRVARFARCCAARVATKLWAIDIEAVELAIAKDVGPQIGDHVDTRGQVAVGTTLRIGP